MWKKLSEFEKERYFLKAHRLNLAYKYKKMIFDKKIKKMLPKKPGGAFQLFLHDQKGKKSENGEYWSSYWNNAYKNLSEDKKLKYEIKAIKLKEKYQK